MLFNAAVFFLVAKAALGARTPSLGCSHTVPFLPSEKATIATEQWHVSHLARKAQTREKNERCCRKLSAPYDMIEYIIDNITIEGR
jgi:hypothetical protein